MGSDNVNDKATPVHTVYLDAFWIKESEVTNAEYLRCVTAKNCDDLPGNDYLHQAEYAEYPVVLITWSQAAAYAAAIGGRLPTEAEWEKAARGTAAANYPWGNDSPDIAFVNQRAALMPVGSFPAGASPYGALDMAGNVTEWVADWYGSNNKERVLRGGSYESNAAGLRSARRDKARPEWVFKTVGFRVVVDEPISK